mmetsp:Transcript_31313/g.61018  ORF Transcript_31313/g.61018 Transcript_31313/m.61018 type:complete len:243 (-) Transcript_31313:1884-2612(-)
MDYDRRPPFLPCAQGECNARLRLEDNKSSLGRASRELWELGGKQPPSCFPLLWLGPDRLAQARVFDLVRSDRPQISQTIPIKFDVALSRALRSLKIHDSCMQNEQVVSVDVKTQSLFVRQRQEQYSRELAQLLYQIGELLRLLDNFSFLSIQRPLSRVLAANGQQPVQEISSSCASRPRVAAQGPGLVQDTRVSVGLLLLLLLQPRARRTSSSSVGRRTRSPDFDRSAQGLVVAPVQRRDLG